jgi:glycosyltransferase involved in cell wall biosynthesis
MFPFLPLTVCASVAEHQRSALVVAYYFPPWGGGPVLRVLKLLKYLDRFGWRLSVLTAEARYYEAVSEDPELLQEISGRVAVVRTKSLQPAGSLARGLQAEAIGGQRTGWTLARTFMPFARVVHELLVPDDKVLWIPFAFRAGLRLIRTRRPTVIYVTTPPHSAGLIAMLLARITHTPLVLDVRDDWIGNPLYARTSKLRGALERWMELAVTRTSSAVIVPTDESKDLHLCRHPEASGRVHVVANGFDPDDVQRACELEPVHYPDARLRLIYTGLLTARRDLTPLLQAIRDINRRIPRSVRMAIAGFVTRDAREAIAALGIASDVQELGYLPHLHALRRVIDADAAVLLSTQAEGARTAVPSKLYEYVACGTPVFGLVDEGATRRLLERYGWGIACAPDNSEAIEAALDELVARKQADTLGFTPEAFQAVQRYSREAQARVVARVLESVAQ